MLLEREPYKFTFRIFSNFGLWDEISIKQKIFVFYLPIFILFIEESLIVFSLFQADSLKERLEAIKIVPMIPVINYSMYSFIKNKKKLKELFAIIDQIESENPNVKMYIDEGCKIVKKIFCYVSAFMILTICIVFITPVAIDKLIFPLYTPHFLGYESLFFYCYWMLESFMAFYSCISYVYVHEFRCSLLVVFYHIMDCFREKLRSLKFNKIESNEAKQKLKKCVRFHLQLKKIMEIYTSTSSVPLYLLLFSSTLTVVSVVFIVANLLEGIENFAFPISYSIFLLILIFVPCVHGSNIEEQSKKFIRDLFVCDWHQADVNDQKMIAIMMENLKKPMSVCGFGFGEINLEFFLNVLNIIYSMYAVVQNMHYKNVFGYY
ncbi:hypothetical protein PVAND_013502 [Polypedilum vanderplanki]|uniref:Odorant receptor n=1 Tax=Polypedilum vanderplanki TaxID=319348 RepID=A0A9J6CPM9_POLVA|nr:hypothetical protein PVAND_013502 [Polypedilum vanderplanki]